MCLGSLHFGLLFMILPIDVLIFPSFHINMCPCMWLRDNFKGHRCRRTCFCDHALSGWYWCRKGWARYVSDKSSICKTCSITKTLRQTTTWNSAQTWGTTCLVPRQEDYRWTRQVGRREGCSAEGLRLSCLDHTVFKLISFRHELTAARIWKTANWLSAMDR